MSNKDLSQQKASDPEIPKTPLLPKDQILKLLELVPDYSFPQDSPNNSISIANYNKEYNQKLNLLLPQMAREFNNIQNGNSPEKCQEIINEIYSKNNYVASELKFRALSYVQEINATVGCSLANLTVALKIAGDKYENQRKENERIDKKNPQNARIGIKGRLIITPPLAENAAGENLN